MPGAKRTQGGSITVDGDDYVWRLHQDPRPSSTNGPRGVVIALRQVGGDREALVEWPVSPPEGATRPKRPNIDATFLIITVRSAITAGWDPRSKGRAVDVMVSRAEAAAFA